MNLEVLQPFCDLYIECNTFSFNYIVKPTRYCEKVISHFIQKLYINAQLLHIQQACKFYFNFMIKLSLAFCTKIVKKNYYLSVGPIKYMGHLSKFTGLDYKSNCIINNYFKYQLHSIYSKSFNSTSCTFCYFIKMSLENVKKLYLIGKGKIRK